MNRIFLINIGAILCLFNGGFLSAQAYFKENEKMPKSTSHTWQDKNFSIAFAGFNGASYYGAAIPGGALVNPNVSSEIYMTVLDQNIRYMFNSNFQISVFSSLQFSFDRPNSFPILLPITMNIGYGKPLGNMHWYIEAGLGRDLIVHTLLVNTSVGMEWLVSKHYALGFNLRVGDYIYEDNHHQFFASLAITSNLVF